MGADCGLERHAIPGECSLWLAQTSRERAENRRAADRSRGEEGHVAELGQMYLLRAQIALIQTTGLEFSLVTQLGMLQRCNRVATSGGVRPSNAKVH